MRSLHKSGKWPLAQQLMRKQNSIELMDILLHIQKTKTRKKTHKRTANIFWARIIKTDHLCMIITNI